MMLVYCDNCKHQVHVDQGIGYGIICWLAPISKSNMFQSCDVVNPHNTCNRFSPTWWFRVKCFFNKDFRPEKRRCVRCNKKYQLWAKRGLEAFFCPKCVVEEIRGMKVPMPPPGLFSKPYTPVDRRVTYEIRRKEKKDG